VFNVGSGTQHLVSEVVDKIIALTEANIQPIYGSFIRPIVEPETWKANLNKTIKMLKWEPKIDMDQGLKKTIEWFRQHSDLNAQRG
jgi:nucleoside-diphosphate-sugar epimerase